LLPEIANPLLDQDAVAEPFRQGLLQHLDQALRLACVMATVPANELIRRTIKSQEDDPRMPAILADESAWPAWLGEDGATPASAKALLKTMEGVNWQSAVEPKKPRPRKA
jgi:hypothetical protein